MSTSTLNVSVAPPKSAPLGSLLLNVFCSPGDVFEQLLEAPPRPANWLVPALLACLTSVVLLGPATVADPTSAPIAEMVQAGGISEVDGEALSASWQAVSSAATCVGVLVGTFWSALVLWFLGRVFLKTRFSYLKTLELVGLTQMILVLGAIVTTLLILATGNPLARPALSLFAPNPGPPHALHALLETMNFFHLWSTAVLSIALARLGGVSFKEAAFWVFGYWFILRAVLILLA